MIAAESVTPRLSAAAPAVSILQFPPDLIHRFRPASGLPPLHQRSRSLHRPRLFLQNIEVVFEIQDLVSTTITALVPGHASAVVLDFDQRRPDSCRYALTGP